jgi:hypothetical protein
MKASMTQRPFCLGAALLEFDSRRLHHFVLQRKVLSFPSMAVSDAVLAILVAI